MVVVDCQMWYIQTFKTDSLLYLKVAKYTQFRLNNYVLITFSFMVSTNSTHVYKPLPMCVFFDIRYNCT